MWHSGGSSAQLGFCGIPASRTLMLGITDSPTATQYDPGSAEQRICPQRLHHLPSAQMTDPAGPLNDLSSFIDAQYICPPLFVFIYLLSGERKILK